MKGSDNARGKSAKKRRESGTVRAYPSLPAGYDLCEILDITGDRKVFKRIVLCSALASAGMILLGALAGPSAASPFKDGFAKGFFAVLMTVVGTVVYIFAHEWVHGIFIRFFTGEHAEYGFIRDMGVAYAKSSCFFTRRAYIVIALAPVIVWGIILTLLMDDVPGEFFWCLYIIQIFNISGSVGDFYTVWRVTRMPKGVLIYDEGASMKFFAPVKFLQ